MTEKLTLDSTQQWSYDLGGYHYYIEGDSYGNGNLRKEGQEEAITSDLFLASEIFIQ